MFSLNRRIEKVSEYGGKNVCAELVTRQGGKVVPSTCLCREVRSGLSSMGFSPDLLVGPIHRPLFVL